MRTKLFLSGIAALFLATGAAHAAEDTKWAWRCSFPHTPSDEQMEEHEQCCKRWPNVPHCNGEWMRAVELCAKLPRIAELKCVDRILEGKKKNAPSHH
jgi:hypothetical protein